MSAAAERPGFELEFQDDFEGSELDGSKWFPYMLPEIDRFRGYRRLG